MFNSFILNLNITYNNIIITFCKKNGEIIFWKSSGCLKFKGSKKSTPYAAQKVMENVCNEILNRKNYKIWLNIKGVGIGRDSAVKSLISFNKIKIMGISDKTPLPHNGCRPPKRRRV
ncbi:30S ribosomal protein S11 [Candidatus Vidania fulgoroideorum]